MMRSTVPISVEEPDEEYPHTVGTSARISLAEPTDATDVFKRSSAGSTIAGLAGANSAKKKTTRPRETPSPKSATARIDMEDAEEENYTRSDQPTDGFRQRPRRKTVIRHKPPKGTVRDQPRSESTLRPSGTEEPPTDQVELGTFASMLGILTLIAMGILVYVLSSQSIAPDLPFPGTL